MLNIWDSADYVSFEPRIAGRFRWESPDQLVFSPSQSLAPATTYKASVKSAVLKYSKYDKVEGGDDIKFHTPDLVLDNSQVIWMLQDETSRMAVPQIDMFFNYRIDPNDLKGKLKIEVDGEKAEFVPVTLSPDNKISVRIQGLKQEDKNLNVKVTIEKGLKPESGSNSTTEPITASFLIPSPYILTIQNITSEHDGVEGLVRVTTSQQLAGESLKPFIKLDPEVTYSTENLLIMGLSLKVTSLM